MSSKAVEIIYTRITRKKEEHECYQDQTSKNRYKENPLEGRGWEW